MKLNYVGRTLIIDITNGWLIMIIVDDCLRSVLLLLSGTMAVTKVSVKDSWLSFFDPTGTGSGYVASSAAGYGAPFAALQDGNRSKAPTTQTRCWGHARMQWAWLQEHLVGGGGPRLHFLNFSARRVGLRGRLGQIGGRQG